MRSVQQTPNPTIFEHPDFDVVRIGDGRLMIEAQIGSKSKRFELEDGNVNAILSMTEQLELVNALPLETDQSASGIEAKLSNKSKRFELEEIVVLVLRCAKCRAENALGKKVEKALIVVDGDIENYEFVDQIGKGIGIFNIFYYTFEHAQL